MTTQLDGYIEVDDDGIARVAGSRVKVIHLAMEKQANGWDADQLHESFPQLTLTQLHLALAYYYGHQAECDRQIEASTRRAKAMQAALPPSRLETRLRAERKHG
jgi:uncharacterized protein (DUF433 family)